MLIPNLKAKTTVEAGYFSKNKYINELDALKKAVSSLPNFFPLKQTASASSPLHPHSFSHHLQPPLCGTGLFCFFLGGVYLLLLMRQAQKKATRASDGAGTPLMVEGFLLLTGVGSQGDRQCLLGCLCYIAAFAEVAFLEDLIKSSVCFEMKTSR